MLKNRNILKGRYHIESHVTMNMVAIIMMDTAHRKSGRRLPISGSENDNQY
jgi:hypothetical protein